MKKYNSKVMINNINFLIDKKGLKIGEVEKMSGVSIGYISRISKEKNPKPNIEFMSNISQILEVSIDTLIGDDLTDMTPNEEYLHNFLEKLIRDSEDDRVHWNVERKSEIINKTIEIDGSTNHPLLNFCNNQAAKIPQNAEAKEIIFKSNSFGCNSQISDDCYDLRIKNGATIYLMNVKKINMKEEDRLFAKEIWMTSSLNGTPEFIASDFRDEKLSSLINNLFKVVKENVNRPNINDDIKYIIDSFMKDDIDDDDLFKDGRIPF